MATLAPSLLSLIEADINDRDQAWEAAFLEALPLARARVRQPEPQIGPDHWPYLLVDIETSDADDTMLAILDWLSGRGIGLALNPTKSAPDYVLSYGMIWNYKERGQFLTPLETNTGKSNSIRTRDRFEVTDGQQLWVGVPTEQYLPKYVRAIVRQFLADQGVFAPKVLMVSQDNVNFDLCFSIESLKTPPAHEHANIAEALSWFLPAHYSVSLLSEKVVQGFTAL